MTSHPSRASRFAQVLGLWLLLGACKPAEELRAPSLARLTASGTRALAGQPLRFRCVADDPQGQALSYLFIRSDGTQLDEWTEPSRGGVEQEHAFEEFRFNHSVRCRAQNASGLVGPVSEPISLIIDPRPVTLTLAVEGEGTVRSTQEGIDCGARCDTVLLEGTRLALAAQPAPGWVFEGWSGSCGGTEPWTEFQVQVGATCTVRFIPNPQRFSLQVKIHGAGRVTSTPAGLSCDADCTATLPGGLMSMRAEPAVGWRFVRWAFSCMGSHEDPAITWVQLTRDGLECTAQFAPTVSLSEGWHLYSSGPTNAVWSPDGTRIAASLGYARTVAIWEASSGKLLRFLHPQPFRVLSVTWSPDGTQLATGDELGYVRFWNTGTGAPDATIYKGEGRLWSLAWSPDGERLASAGEEEWSLWDFYTRKSRYFSWLGVELLNQVQWSPDGKWLALEHSYGGTELFDVDGTQVGTVPGRGFIWSPRSDAYASASGYKIDIRQREDGMLLRTLDTRLPPDGNWITRLAWSADGRYLAAGAMTRFAVLDSATGATVGGPLDGQIRGLAFHPERPELLLNDGGRLSVLPAEGPTAARTLEPVETSPIDLAWSPDVRTLATVGQDGRVWLWSSAGQWLRTLSGSGKVTSVAWDPTSTWLAVGTAEGTVTRWNALDGAEAGAAWTLGQGVNKVAWSQDGLSVAAAGQRGRLAVWDTGSGEDRFSQDAHPGALLALAWSPDGKRLLTGGGERTASLWDAFTGERLWTSPDQGDAVSAVAWSPDGQLLATTGAPRSGQRGTGTVRLWDATTRAKLGTLPGNSYAPTGTVTSLSWHHLGDLLAGLRSDGFLEVWNIRSRTLMDAQGLPLRGGLSGVTWAPRGYTLATSTEAGLMTWRVNFQ
ncbi:InlB B-repeat-containing protein [Archangium gephyra]|uniref:WD40 domain-containing protein n=1 Tax=Archangium gephyra TaxID=48 RepID=UPI003B81ABC3